MCKKLIYFVCVVLVLGLTAGPAKAETIWVEAEDYDTLSGPLELFRPNLTASGLACLGTDEGRGDRNSDPPAANDGVATYNITVAGGTYKIVARWKQASSNSFWWRIATGTSAEITHASGAASCNGWPGNQYWSWADVRDDNTDGDPTVNWLLTAGDHVVEVMRREDGTWLDGFIVTDNLTLDRNTLPDLIIDPTRATDPGPGDGARKAAEMVQLTWTAGTTAVGNHKVLFGTDPGSLAEIATPAVGTETADPGILAYNTDHYWQIVENDGAGDLPGPIWTFRTTPDPALMANPDIIGEWLFENDFTDSSGYEYHGAEAGSVSIVSDPERGLVALFESNDHPRVEIGDDQIFNPEGDFSISLWANIGSWTGNWANVMISKYGDDNLGWQLRRANSDLFSFTTRSDGDQDCRSNDNPPLNQWVHITVVYDTATSKKRIYYDGVLNVERNGSNRHVRTTHHIMWIGTRSNNRNNNHDRHFTGMLDNIRFYTKALTLEEIADLAVANIATNPNPTNGEDASVGVSGANLTTTLTFDPGLGVVSHEAFFSDDIQDVIDRNPANSLGSPPYETVEGYEYTYYVGLPDTGPPFAQVSLEREKTYYWTVDENDGTTTWLGHIWSFTVMPIEAWKPNPADGARFVPADAGVALSWTLGDVALDPETDEESYDVYYGTVKADVETGETPNINVTDPTHTTDPLPKDTVYYWRVDTVVTHETGTPPFETTVIPGKLWQFTTLQEITISDPNLIGWWKLNGNVIDWSGHGNDGIAIGDPQYVPGPVVDEAMDFDSVDDLIDLNDKMLDGTFTVALWLQWDGHTGSYNSIMHNNAWNSGSLHLHLRNDGDMNPDVHSQTSIRANTRLTVGQWTHFAVTYDMDAMVARLYLDGAQDHQVTLTGGGTPYIGPMNIGAYQEGSRYFDGRMSDWRLYNRALSQAEIAHIMDVRKAWNPSPINDAYDVPLSKTLTWNAGTDPDTGSEYTKHDVYFGTNFDDVDSGTVPTATVIGINEHTPPAFDYYETCYWRVDGVNASNETLKGNVWTFVAIYNDALIVDPNLVGWWKLDGDPTDSSGYGHHGIENGNPGYVTGYDGQAIDFDRSDDYIDCGNPPRLNMVNKLTVASWIKGPFTRGWECFVTKRGEGDGWKLRRRGGSNNACFTIRDTSGGDDPQGSININTGEWHHVVGTWDGANRILYVDGQLDRSDADTGTMTATGDENVLIGAWMAGPGDVRDFAGITLDDIRIYDYALTNAQVIEVMRINLAWAWIPDPKNGETGFGLEPTLSWTPGDYAPLTDGHFVYFGADDLANLALAADQPQSPSNYSPGTLDLDTTYYWAIDEVNVVAPGGVDPGKIWSFTTSDHLVVDDMDSYDSQGPNWIFNTWKDGFGDVNCVGGNGTGSGLSSGDIRLSDFQSMKYEYDNDGMVSVPYPSGPLDEPRALYSVVTVNVADLPSGIGSDWTVGGAEALVLHFYGGTTNSIESMWVELTDGAGGKATATYGDYADEDPCDIDKASWHQWNINLQTFADGGVTLTDVSSIAIGIGDPGATEPGGGGEIYFDDIRLYAPRCILSRRGADFALVDYAPEGDPGGDCVIDYKELDVMSGDWLEYDFNVAPVEPNAAGLVAWYELENDANDSSPNELDGTENGTPFYAAGPVGQAMSFDGFDDYIDCGTNSAFDLTDSVSVACWIKVTTFDKSWQAIVTKGDNSWRIHRWGGGNGINWAHNGLSPLSMGGGTNVNDGAWHHIAGTYDGTNRVLYVDGKVDASDTPTGTINLSTHPVRIGENAQATGRFWSGMIDDVQIYNYGLTHNEIVSVRGLGTIYVPVTSPANISDNEPVLEKIVNFKDYAELMNVWLDEDMFP